MPNFDPMWLVTTASLVGTIANIYKKQWCFIVWLCTNILWAAYNAQCNKWPAATLFSIYACLAVWGLYKWSHAKATPAKEEAAT